MPRLSLTLVQRRDVGVESGDRVWYTSPTTGERRQATIYRSPLSPGTEAFRRVQDEGLAICEFSTGRVLTLGGGQHRVARIEALQISTDFVFRPAESFEVADRVLSPEDLPLPPNWFTGEDEGSYTWHNLENNGAN